MFVPQLFPTAADSLVKLLQFFVEALTLGAHINLAFIEHVHVKTSGASRSWEFGERRLYKHDLLDVCQALDRPAVVLDHGPNNRLMGEQLDWNFDLRLDFQLGPQITHADNQILQNRHLGLGGKIKLLLIGLGIGSQGNRLHCRIPLLHRLPDFLGDERHDRMQQAQRSIEQVDQIRAGGLSRTLVSAFFKVQSRLDQFQVPVAKLAPEKIVDSIRSLMETKSGERIIDIRSHAIKARKNPAVFENRRVKTANSHVETAALGYPGPQARFNSVHIHEHESGRIPDLVGKGAIAIRPALVKGNVSSRRSHRRQREARGIRSKALDNLQRIDYVALGLRHLLAFGIAHQSVNVDLTEGQRNRSAG